MKIELTALQLGKIITLVHNEYQKDTKNNAFYLGLQHNLQRQETDFYTKTTKGKSNNSLTNN